MTVLLWDFAQQDLWTQVDIAVIHHITAATDPLVSAPTDS